MTIYFERVFIGGDVTPSSSSSVVFLSHLLTSSVVRGKGMILPYLLTSYVVRCRGVLLPYLLTSSVVRWRGVFLLHLLTISLVRREGEQSSVTSPHID